MTWHVPASHRHDRHRRLALLQRIVTQCLPESRRSAVDPLQIEAWLQAFETQPPRDLLASLAPLLQAAPRHDATGPSLAKTFASALIEQARADVRREAEQAGQAALFEQLAPSVLAGRAVEHPLLDRAAIRLARRFRQRVDAGLRLWYPADLQAREQLRLALHAALVEESGHEHV